MGGKFSRRNKGKSTVDCSGPSLRKKTVTQTPHANIVPSDSVEKPITSISIRPTYGFVDDSDEDVEFLWRQRDVMEEEWRHVGAASQLIKRRCHRLYAESGRPFDLVLFTINNTFTAMSTWCSHMGGPLHEGDIEDYKGKKCVQCPWHGYMFDIETGTNPDIGLRQDVFETRVVDNKVYVHHPRCKLSMEPFNS